MACLTPLCIYDIYYFATSPFFFSFCPYPCSSKLSKSWLHHQGHWFKFKARVFQTTRFLRYRIPFFSSSLSKNMEWRQYRLLQNQEERLLWHCECFSLIEGLNCKLSSGS